MSDGPNTGPIARRPNHAVCRQPVCWVTRSCYKGGIAPHRILIHISRREHRVLDPDDVYYLRARGGETEIRLRSRTPLIDVRPIGEVAPLFEPLGFVRVHREHAVNIVHVRLLRLQADGRDWELKLEPPVNRVLSIARDRLGGLRDALGKSAG
jgi:DNA-binding LytR/AlgR family response regulator